MSGRAQVTMQAKLIDSISGVPVSFATISLFTKDIKRPLQKSISAADAASTSRKRGIVNDDIQK